MNRLSRVAGVVAAGIALAGGCTGTEDGGAAAESLADYLGYSPLGDERANAIATVENDKLTDEERRRERAVEDLTASCMRDKGFEYVPWSPDLEENREPYPIELQASLSAEEFARKYGYGITTITVKRTVDPNQEIWARLSPEAQKAYDDALWGDGCHEEADRKVNGDADAEELRLQKEFEDLAEDIGRLEQRLLDDPRMREALTGWADCMADGGYPGLEEPVDAQNVVGERMSEILDDPTKAAEVRAFEVTTATTDHECQREHLEPVRAEVATRLEKQFVAEHRAELERFRERAGDSGLMLGRST
jgi:hypothetical protein